MEEKKFTKTGCIELLKSKNFKINENGEKRYPKRSDFTAEEVEAIKAFLGPWPRALEEAGLKPKREDGGRLMKNREKRIRAKRNRRKQEKNEIEVTK